MIATGNFLMALSVIFNMWLFWFALKKFVRYQNTRTVLLSIGGFFVMWFFSVYYQTTAAQRLTLPIWFIALSLFITALMYCGLIHLCFNKYRKSGD